MISFVLYGNARYNCAGYYKGMYVDDYGSDRASVTDDISEAIVYQAEFTNSSNGKLSIVGTNSLPEDYVGNWTAKAVTVGIREI